jgi:hypothetical protein
VNRFIPPWSSRCFPSVLLIPKVFASRDEFWLPQEGWASAQSKGGCFKPALGAEANFGRGSAALRLCGYSKSCLDAGGEGAKVADALDFVIRELDPEVVFEARKQF